MNGFNALYPCSLAHETAEAQMKAMTPAISLTFPAVDNPVEAVEI